METIPVTLNKSSDAFLKDIQDAFGKSLISVIMYGPAVRGESAKTPYINFLVTVKDSTPSELAHCSKYLKSWYKKLIAVPLFITPDYVTKSLDTFPLEFMEMASSHALVYGEDVLDGLKYSDSDIRNECEREIKGKLLHLRSEYLSLRGNTKGLIDLVQRSLNTFRLLFAGALYLKKCDIPAETSGLLDAVAGEYELDLGLFKKLIAISKGELKISDDEADTLFDLYVEELDKLSEEIDFMS